MVSNSVALIPDAINNLSDAGSSIITIFGSKLASKIPGEAHPYGYGRTEYVGGLIVSVIVLMLEFQFLKTSVENIFAPELTSFTIPFLAFLFCAIFVKFALGFYYKNRQTNQIYLAKGRLAGGSGRRDHLVRDLGFGRAVILRRHPDRRLRRRFSIVFYYHKRHIFDKRNIR